MVHRTHLKIFDDYYPDEFDNWWLDNWISVVYGNSHTTKLIDWVVVHHINYHGTRYAENDKQKSLLPKWVDRGKNVFRDILSLGIHRSTLQFSELRLSLVERPICDATLMI
jgi:hypothetical protein